MKDQQFTDRALLGGIVLLGAFFFLPFLGRVHLFDWDEVNFAESAREMLLTGDFFRVRINFIPFWEKPPFFFWLQSLCMSVLGVNEYAARLPNALIGMVTLGTLFWVGRQWKDRTFGLIWAVLYLGSFLPHLYFKSGIIDPVFNYFIFLGVFFLARTVSAYGQPGSMRLAIYAGLSIGTAILTKGPVGFLILLLSFLIFWALRRFGAVGRWQDISLFGLAAAMVTFLWFGMETLRNGPWFLQEFITYQIRLFSTPDAGHEQPWFYHFVVVFLGCFPASVFALRGFGTAAEGEDPWQLRRWMVILFWVVMILFTIVTTKIVHYSSMAYFPVTFLGAYHLHRLLTGKATLSKAGWWLFLGTGLIFATLLTAVPFVGVYKEWLIPYIQDDFAVGCLQAPVRWAWYDFAFGPVYAAGVIGSAFLWKRHEAQKAFLAVCFGTAFCMLGYTATVVPKIEEYVQGAAIRFHESLVGQDVYVNTIDFKSYAHYYYTQKPPVTNPASYDDAWLLHGDIDKPVYFIAKITSEADIQARYPHLRRLGREHGFVFYVREKNTVSPTPIR